MGIDVHFIEKPRKGNVMTSILIILYSVIFIYSFFNHKVRKFCFIIGLLLIGTSENFFTLISILPTKKVIFIGTIIGYFSYLISTFMVSRPIKIYKLIPFKKHIIFNKTNIYNLISIFRSCTYEEFLWRGVVYVYFGSNLISFIITVIFFSLMHLRKMFLIQFIDIIIFAILIVSVKDLVSRY